MKNFKEFLAEAKVEATGLATTVTKADRPSTANKQQIGFIHLSHGKDFKVYKPDSHDLAYFGKGVYRIEGVGSGKKVAGYVDWKKGTVSFYSGNPLDDQDFEKPVKFKGASIYESVENLSMFDDIADDIEVCFPLTESVSFDKGKVYKMESNDMLLKYTGRTKHIGSGSYYVFTVVDSSGNPRMVSGKKFEQNFKGDMLKTLKAV